MQLTLREHLLVDQSLPDEELGKMMTQTIAGSVWSLPTQLPVLVWWKRAFHFKLRQDIGDGMSLVTLYERAPLTFGLDTQACLHWLLTYASYDEEKNATHYFLYKSAHTSDELARIDEWLQRYFPSITLQRARFKELVVPTTFVLPKLALDTPQQVFSWLFGLSVAYGTWQVRDERLVRILLTIPQVGSLSAVSVVCEELKPMLRDLGVYLVIQSSPGKLNDTLQIVLQDPEMLALFASWYTGEELHHDSVQSSSLEAFLQSNGVDLYSAQLLAHSVLKMREK